MLFVELEIMLLISVISFFRVKLANDLPVYTE